MKRTIILGAGVIVGGVSIGLGSQQLNPAAVEATQIEPVTVSYTHLTLPTILRV